MKKKTFISLFVGAHIFFIVAHIQQYSQLIKICYQKQKNEVLKSTLLQKKQQLTQQLYALHNKAAIKQFAQRELKMEPISLTQIKKLRSW